MTDFAFDDLTDRLTALGARQGSAPFLQASGRSPMSFATLSQRIAALRTQFDRLGITRGDIVAGAVVDRLECAAALAILPASCTYVPLNPARQVASFVDLFGRIAPRAVLVPSQRDHPIVAAARQLGIAEIAMTPDLAGEAGAFDLALARGAPSLDRPRVERPPAAYIDVTSGTTGRSKLVPHGHRQLLAQAQAMGEWLALTPDDVAAYTPAIHFALGKRTAFLVPVLNGASVYCLPESDGAALHEAIRAERVTFVPATFAVQRELLERAQAAPVRSRRLRFLCVASGALEPVEIEALERALHVPALSAYGATEIGTALMQSLDTTRRRPGNAGLPMGTEVRIVDADGAPCAAGTTGEIQVRGPQVFDGYVDDPALDAEAFADGWFRMGDLGALEPNGEVRVVGRLHDLINRGGEKIAPARIDAVLRTMPQLAEGAAFGVPHPRLGEEIVAAVVAKPGAGVTAEAVRDHVRHHLGARYAPRRVWLVDALPRTDTGKLRRSALREAVGFDSTSFGAPDMPDRSDASPLELALGGLWAGVLKLAKVERDVDFFMLGGDSLRGASLVEQVHAVFGVALPVQALFEDAGTVAAMARRIERERGANRHLDRPRPLPRRAPGTPVPLSHTQARAWFLHRLDPDSDAYHESRLWHIDGAVDVDALRRALALVAERQAILRTRYVVVDGEPRQVIGAPTDLALEVVDLAGPDAEQALDAAVAERMSRPFDLAAAPPVRIVLFTLGPGRHALLRVWHHIANDGLSSPILQDDLTEAYAAVRAGRSPAWTPLPIDYADFAVWQRRELVGAALDRAIEAWKRKLADLPTLALPTDRVRPPAQSFRGGVVSRRLPAAPAAAMKALAREHGATAYMAFLAAYAALLSRLSGDLDFAIGTPVAGRTRPELARLIGFFANTLAVRADLAGAPSFVELLKRTRETMVDALERQEVPFERLVDALGVPRDPSRNPLFQVAFAMREGDTGDLELDGATVRRDEGRHGRAKFDLTLSLVDGRDGIAAHWEYCADLFDRATIERMARQFEALVGAAAAAPDRAVDALAMMDDATRERLVAASQNRTPWPADRTIVSRFAEQVAATPDAVAIGSLTYGAVDERANRLAHALVAAGVARGSCVGVARAKTAELVIAWLAVLKAGAAYVPIDPELPAGRIGFVLSDAGIAHAITDDVIATRLARPGVTTITPDAGAAAIAARPATAPADRTTPDDPAYVIYTSGSTGVPKGVVVPHRAVVRLVCGADYVTLSRDDVVAQLASPAFDASTFEIWGPLLNGARIVPIARTIALAPRALASTLAAERVTTLFLTTALFNAIAREVPTAFAACTNVLFGGEAVEPRWVRDVLRAGPPKRLLHVYGPTETTTFATWQVVREVPPDAQTVPIGRPIANTDAFVLRADGEPAAPGEPGELYLGGPGVALGYLGRPDLTAEHFVERAVAPLPAQRLYRTGDRVRCRDDLAIEFLGRRDRQVKVRGHRIELEEIEAVLARMPQVRDAVVALRGETSDTRQVVAYLVPADPSVPPPVNLLREMRRVLPEYMLPGAIVWLPALPLNASGKVDRAALPPPADAERPERGVLVPPRDLIEGVLARIWQDVLGIATVGVHDHFFEIGGHSLLAARLVDTIEQETGYAVPLTAMFADDTIAGVARALREGAPIASAPILPVNVAGSRAPFVYLHGDFIGGGFYSRTIAHALGPDQPTLIVHPHGLTEDTIPATIEEMAADRLRAVRAVQPRGPYLVGGHCNGALVAFEMARQLAAAGESVPAVVLIEARAPDGRDPADGDAPASFVKVNAPGGPRMMQAHDRSSDAELRYVQAMDRYVGRRYEGHVVVIKAQERFNSPSDLGWSRLASSVEAHFVPGDHRTLITRHIGDLAATIRAALARAVGVPA